MLTLRMLVVKARSNHSSNYLETIDFIYGTIGLKQRWVYTCFLGCASVYFNPKIKNKKPLSARKLYKGGRLHIKWKFNLNVLF